MFKKSLREQCLLGKTHWLDMNNPHTQMNDLSLSNSLILEGTICKSVQFKKSPAGVPHTHFLLEHRSMQIEANLQRQAWCKIPVVASGDKLQSVSQSLVMGSKVQVKGFISSHQSKSGLPKLVLHAEQINILTHGE